MDKLLSLLEDNSNLSHEQIAAILNISVEEVENKIRELEKNKTILGYKALIDWDKTDRELVTALIELKVSPQRGAGFDVLAKRIYNYPEVKSVYLLSGGFDILVTIEGKTMKEVAFFVAEKLAQMENVISTTTHFVLKKYKDKGLRFDPDEKDERGMIGI